MQTEQISLQDYLSHKPETCLNWRGKPESIDWPNGRTVARCGEVYMIQRSKDSFAVVYCLQVHANLTRVQAAREFGECCLHQAQCETLLTE